MNINEEIIKALTSHMNFKGLDIEVYSKNTYNKIDLEDENVERYARGGYFDNYLAIYTIIDSIEKNELLFEFSTKERETNVDKYTKDYVIEILLKLLNYEYVIFNFKIEENNRFLEIDKLMDNKMVSFEIKEKYKDMYESILYLIERLKDNAIYFYFKNDANERNKKYLEKLINKH